RLLCPEPDRVRELLRVFDPSDLEDADADTVVRDPEADVSARQLVLLEERAQGSRERLRLPKLARDDDPLVELLARDLLELGMAVVGDASGRELRRADLQADDPLRELPRGVALGLLGCGLALRLLRGLRLLLALGRLRLALPPRLLGLGGLLGLRLALERDLLLEERGLRLLRGRRGRLCRLRYRLRLRRLQQRLAGGERVEAGGQPVHVDGRRRNRRLSLGRGLGRGLRRGRSGR